jgi:hypothetical protein
VAAITLIFFITFSFLLGTRGFFEFLGEPSDGEGKTHHIGAVTRSTTAWGFIADLLVNDDARETGDHTRAPAEGPGNRLTD